MRRHSILIVGLLAAVTSLPEPAQAQSLRGLLGVVTSPLRGIIGGVHRHRPMPRYRGAREASVGAAAGVAAGAAASQTQAATSEPARGRNARKPGKPAPLSAAGAYEDVVGYVLWPNAYEARYRRHGFGDIVTSITGPVNASAAVASARTSATNGSAAQDGPNETGSVDVKAACASRAATEQDWPAAQIRQTVNLNTDARIAVNKLQVAMLEAGEPLDPGCNDADLTPIKRLDALKQRLWAVQSADTMVRAPLKTFYDSLSDSQKAVFNKRQDMQKGTQRAERRSANTQQQANAAPMGQQYQICAAQISGDPERLMRQIQQTLQPTPEQRAAVEAFGKTSGEMAKMMIASCAQPVGNTPLARLDAANNQLTTMNHVATTMQIALNSLYGQLSNEQKAKFDALGR